MGTGRRLKITHRTGYRYSEPVDASFNEVRMTPLDGDGQVLLNHRLTIAPIAAVQTYTDYWGASVEAFEVHIRHRLLEITATSTVDTPPMHIHEPGGPWESLQDPAILDSLAEYLTSTDYVDAMADDRRAIAADLRGVSTPEEAVRDIMRIVRDRITYTPGATTVSTTASQAWASGHGVCQDFAHVTLALLRSLGIPARYVSGYLHTEHEALGETVVGESHAWVEYWDQHWHAIDPTNERAVGSAHVIVARGRDYADVPPLKGIYAGGRSEGLGVQVEITQIPQ